MPQTIGRYEVKRLLGAGAMGAVYLAEDPRLKRRIALKVVKLDALRSAQDRQECLLRFQREAEISALLQHPGIVMVFDYGDEPGLGPYLAMEYVQGKTLDGLIKSGDPVTLKEKLRIGAGIAEALDHAHARGVVHRDVKPGNVLLGEGGRPKLMDFGIAKREDAHLTQTGTFLGTPSYASPEQIREGIATPRSDVFSLGVVMFELLSGVLPFPGNSINTILYRIVNEPPVPIQPPVTGLLPKAWDRIFLKALAKQPEARYSNCTQFIRDLVEAAAGLDHGERAEIQGLLRDSALTMVAPVLTEGLTPTHLASLKAPMNHGRRMALTGAVVGASLLLLGGAYIGLQRFGGESVLLRSLPEKAMVTQDGRELGATPLPGTFRPGEKLRLEAKGFRPAEWVIRKGEKEPLVTLEPVVSQELLRSDPPGAVVVLDDRRLDAVTPVTVSWNQGERHRLNLSKGALSFNWNFLPGETPGDRVFTLTDGSQEVELGASTGFLKVAGAFPIHVKVDGGDQGELKPGERLKVEPGVRKLELSQNRVFYRETRTLTFLAGHVQTLELPGTAKLTVSTFPNYFQVILDGIPTGVLSDGFSPLTVVKGTHTIQIEGRSVHRRVKVDKDTLDHFKI